MAGFKENTFSDRLTAAEAAKKAALERFRAKVSQPPDPELLAKRAELVKAREEREAKRAIEKAAKAERDRLLAIEAEAKRLADEEAAKIAAIEEAAARAAIEAGQKAARDARYAARKARK
jgi:hypothetical protein